MSPWFVRAVATLIVTAAAACSDATVGPSETVVPITELPRNLSVAEQALVGASNRFTIDLLRRVRETSPDSTIFLSPLSASMALGMTMNGAAGDTRAQMEDMLGFDGLAAEGIEVAYRDLIGLLRGLDPRVDFRLANAIFHRNEFQMEASFLSDARDYFDARVEGLDFGDPRAADHINEWVRDATEDRIDGIINPPIDAETMAFLMNAIYFKGDWTGQFDPRDTYSGPFHLANGGTESVRFMVKEDPVGLRSSDSWTGVELPYGGGAWVMTIAMPRPGYDVDAVLADLESILDPSVEWRSGNARLHLPRFELEWGRTLNDDLKALGMVDAFSELDADLTPMYAAARAVGLHVENVKQKTFMKVDEEGTEAAAVTVVEITNSCACGPPELRVDRPFFLAIRERLSGTVPAGSTRLENEERRIGTWDGGGSI
jgi:serpin B